MGMYLLLSGLWLTIAMQFVVFLVAFKNSLPKAMLCLMIPCYVYAYAQRDPQARPFLWGWYIGIVLLIAGVIACS